MTITTGNLTFTSAPRSEALPGARSGFRAAHTAAVRAAHTVAVRGAHTAGAWAAHTVAATAPVDQRPDLGITVSVTGGRLARVVATTRSGRRVPGTFAAGGTAWHSDWALSPAQAYRVTATAVSPHGQRTVTSGSFRTLSPPRTFTASTTLASGQAYGVGMPIMIAFSRPVTDRTEVERSLRIWSSKPVTGAWYWMSGTQVWFRPRTYWPAHTRVRVQAHLKGVRGAPGVYGASDLDLHFRIGNSLVAVASAATHRMRVWWDGHLAGNWPVSTGEPGLDTPDGHYLSFAMGNPVDMDSATFGVMPGDPGYYNVMVYDSVQFTDSGDYIHSAPWSVGEQGFANVSHGCVNVAPGEAAWYYGHSLIGDPITVTGSPVRGTWGDGWTIWFLPWRKLVAGSAAGRAVQAGPGGSRLVAPGIVTPNHPHLFPPAAR